MEIRNLIVEVTRKCNMKCEHCLRGSLQRIEQTKENIDLLLKDITEIGMVTFSGGEPSLNVPIMEYFLEVCKRKRIYISNFYIATNGLKIKEDFVLFCIKMYSYCDEKELCSVQISNDMYHSDCGEYDSELLEALTFFSKRNDDDDYNYNYGQSLIKQGKSKKGHKKEVSEIETEDDLIESEIYLNCKGEIINGCDWSYIEQKKHILCNVKDLKKWYDTIFNI